jgi:hypothetical protein
MLTTAGFTDFTISENPRFATLGFSGPDMVMASFGVEAIEDVGV